MYPILLAWYKNAFSRSARVIEVCLVSILIELSSPRTVPPKIVLFILGFMWMELSALSKVIQSLRGCQIVMEINKCPCRRWMYTLEVYFEETASNKASFSLSGMACLSSCRDPSDHVIRESPPYQPSRASEAPLLYSPHGFIGKHDITRVQFTTQYRC